jgi:hypothetical protein
MNVVLARLSILSVYVFALAVTSAHAQSPTVTSVPRIVRVTSTFHPADGKPPAAVETMTLSIYAEETGGVTLWQETQKVAVSPDGRFTLLLGSTRPEGLPLDLFASGEPRWLAIHVERPGEGEPARIRLLVLNSDTTSADAAKTADSAGAPLTWAKGDFKIQVFGAVRLDAMYNTARVQGPGLPAFLVPKFTGGFREATIAMNARNSSVGVLFTGPDIGNFHSGGRLSAVFFDNTNVFADRNGFLLTSGYGELFNDQWRFAAGLQLDILAPLLPTVLTFSADGAPIGDSIKGQIRVERYLKLGSESQVTLQGGISEPLNSASSPDISLDEDNGWPNVEGRVVFGVGKPAPIGIGLLTPRPLEVAVSGVVGQLRRTAFPPDTPRRVVSDVWGVAVDTQGNFNGLVGFKGEAYTGQGLGQMTGGILQSLDAVTWKAIRSTGGWVEGFVYLTPNLHSHTGMFIDDVNDDDLTAIPQSLFGRTYNSAIWSNVLWDVTKNYRIAFEVTHRRTEYKEPTNLPNHGFGFQTQFAWTF